MKEWLWENLQQAVDALRKGLRYCLSTEGVFGLGCDPDSQTLYAALIGDQSSVPWKKG